MNFPGTGAAGPQHARGNRTMWTVKRIAATVGGVVLVLFSLVFIGTGAAAALMSTSRDGGYVDLDSMTAHTSGYALSDSSIVADEVGLGTSSDGLLSILGTARVRVISDGSTPILVGIAPSDAAAAYLRGVDSSTFKDTAKGVVYATTGGGAPDDPTRQDFWIARSTGTGTISVTAPAQDHWTVVVMNADGSKAIGARVYLDATFPALPWIAAGLILVGFVLLAAGLLLILIPRRRARR